jgi:hypothetical protein
MIDGIEKHYPVPTSVAPDNKDSAPVPFGYRPLIDNGSKINMVAGFNFDPGSAFGDQSERNKRALDYPSPEFFFVRAHRAPPILL